MKDGRIIRQGVAWEPAAFDGANRSGYEPMNDCLLVKMDIAAASTGGIILTDDAVEKHTLASETGVIIATGPTSGDHVIPGDRVYVGKYSGQVLHGDDGQVYRVMSATCIGARKSRRLASIDLTKLEIA